MHSEAQVIDPFELDERVTSADAAIHTCPDCGSPGDGAFCSVCGEEMRVQMPEVRHYLRELLNEFLAFDSRLARSFPMLVLKPGFLTQEYVAGRRKRYLMPSRLFMIVAVLSFLFLGNFVHTHLMHYYAQKQRGTLTMFTLQGAAAEAYLDQLLRLFSGYLPYGLLILCTPAFATFLKLLYRRTDHLFSEHLVFTFHVFAFALLVMVPLMLINAEYGIPIGFGCFLVYLYFAMRRVHEDRGVSLAVRFTLTSVAFFGIFSFTAFFTLVIALGLGTFFGQLPKAFN